MERKGEKEGLGDNPGWKCPENRNSATGVDYESWPQLQGAKPLKRKSRKPDQVDIARYSKEQIDVAIDVAVQAFGLESLKHQQQKAIEEFVSGRDVFVALPAGFGKSYCFALLPTVFDHLRAGKEPSIIVCVSPVTDLVMETEAGLAHKCRFIRQIAVKAGEWMICVLLHKAVKQF